MESKFGSFILKFLRIAPARSKKKENQGKPEEKTGKFLLLAQIIPNWNTQRGNMDNLNKEGKYLVVVNLYSCNRNNKNMEGCNILQYNKCTESSVVTLCTQNRVREILSRQ